MEWSWMNIVFVYTAVISLVGVFLMMSDKGRAINQKYRIPERTLLTVAALGGAMAMLMMARLIRHKTKRPKFMLGMPMMAIVHVGLFIYFFYVG